ncbi:hypothetical protein OIV83_003604 [Microbotryomycetes sp. JL201]|nr:hypothetical protein OIV83_003604 [Microbotryomycetes sp. JL201]
MATSMPSTRVATPELKESRPSLSAEIHVDPLATDSMKIESIASEEHVAAASANPFANRGSQFWLVFLALCVSCFLSALDLTAVSTTLPSMAADLNAKDYSWVGSAYALTSTALIPWTGGLAAIFGRRSILIASLLIFAAGSTIIAAGPNITTAIVGRSIQGVGGGGILTMTEIVITDLLPLSDRGPFFGILGSVWAIASAIGPPIGGALASAGAWRWLYYLNLPLTGIALVLVLFFLKIKEPQTTLKEKLAQMDYVNVVFVAGSTFAILGLTWGGVTYSWASWQVLVPLILGLACMVAFFWIEKTWVKNPTVPFDILRNRTTVLAYIGTFLHSIAVLAAVYYLPPYLQASKGFSAVKSGVNLFSLSFTIAPMAIVIGILVPLVKNYKYPVLSGWIVMTLAFGLMTMLKWDSGKAEWVAYPTILGIGLGISYSAQQFAVLAPIKPQQQAMAMAFFGFVRSFGQVFGIAIGATVLQNELNKSLPTEFIAQLTRQNGGHANGEIAFAAIPIISTLQVILIYALQSESIGN